MLKPLLDPKIDFVFKQIFGSSKHPRVLISFLNATLKPTFPIKHVEIQNTDLEKQFIEIPKLEDSSDEKDLLVAWTEFLKNPESQKVRNLEMGIEEIREAKDELIRLSGDKEQRRLYDMRSKIIRDEISALNKAKREGVEEGIKEGQYKIARRLLSKALDIETVADMTELSIEEVRSLL